MPTEELTFSTTSTGIDDRGRRIAEATLKALLVKLHQLATAKPLAAALALGDEGAQRRAM